MEPLEPPGDLREASGSLCQPLGASGGLWEPLGALSAYAFSGSLAGSLGGSCLGEFLGPSESHSELWEALGPSGISGSSSHLWEFVGGSGSAWGPRALGASGSVWELWERPSLWKRPGASGSLSEPLGVRESPASGASGAIWEAGASGSLWGRLWSLREPLELTGACRSSWEPVGASGDRLWESLGAPLTWQRLGASRSL